MRAFDPASIRDQFPILAREVHGKPLVYLDNAATSQTPTAVLDASRRYYEEYNANIHRGTHHLSQVATAAHEEARRTVAAHLNAGTAEDRMEQLFFQKKDMMDKTFENPETGSKRYPQNQRCAAIEDVVAHGVPQITFS